MKPRTDAPLPDLAACIDRYVRETETISSSEVKEEKSKALIKKRGKELVAMALKESEETVCNSDIFENKLLAHAKILLDPKTSEGLHSIANVDGNTHHEITEDNVIFVYKTLTRQQIERMATAYNLYYQSLSAELKFYGIGSDSTAHPALQFDRKAFFANYVLIDVALGKKPSKPYLEKAAEFVGIHNALPPEIPPGRLKGLPVRKDIAEKRFNDYIREESRSAWEAQGNVMMLEKDSGPEIKKMGSQEEKKEEKKEEKVGNSFGMFAAPAAPIPTPEPNTTATKETVTSPRR